MQIKILVFYAMFLFSFGIFILHVIVRIKNERLKKTSFSLQEREFWHLLRARTLICAIVALLAVILAMATNYELFLG